MRSSTPSSATSAESLVTLQLREILEHRGAVRGVALPVLLGQFPHRVPGADVGPAAGHRHDRCARCLFHHRIVDRDRLRRAERLRLQRHEAEIAAGIGDGIGDRLHARRIHLAIFIEQQGRGKHEVAAVPEIARIDVVGGLHRIRLLDEARDRVHFARDHLARADIAVFGRRPLRLDAEGDDALGLGRNKAFAAGGDEGGIVLHHVVGGEREHDRVAGAVLREHRARGNRRPGVTPHRLEDHVGLDADLGQLLQHHEAVGRIGDDDRTIEQRGIRDARERVLEGRARAEQRQELLGAYLARSRPQPRAGTAAHDQGDDAFVHRHFKP